VLLAIVVWIFRDVSVICKLAIDATLSVPLINIIFASSFTPWQIGTNLSWALRKTATTPSEYITVQGMGSGLLVVKALM